MRRVLRIIDWFLEPWLRRQSQADLIVSSMRPRLAIGLSLLLAPMAMVMGFVYLFNRPESPAYTAIAFAGGAIMFGNAALARITGSARVVVTLLSIELFALHTMNAVAGPGFVLYTFSITSLIIFLQLCLMGMRGGTIVSALMVGVAIVLHHLERTGQYQPFATVSNTRSLNEIVSAIAIIVLVIGLGGVYEGTHTQARNALTEALKQVWAEMDLAQKIQTLLLPPSPQLKGYQVAAKMKPATDVGGDYYDFITVGNQQWVVIGDVSGHGVSAGLVMMMIQAAIQSTIRNAWKTGTSITPADVITLVNSSMYQNMSALGDKYMTLSILRVEGNEIQHAGCHQDIFVFRARTQSVERLNTRGVWVGIFEKIDQVVHNDQVVIEPGDKLLLYTDGLTEARRDEGMLDVSGLEGLFSRLAPENTPVRVVEKIFDHVHSYEVNDDMTLICMERSNESAAAAA